MRTRVGWSVGVRHPRDMSVAGLGTGATRRSHARPRMIQFRGRVIPNMVYEDVPAQDVFRRLGADAVLKVI